MMSERGLVRWLVAAALGGLAGVAAPIAGMPPGGASALEVIEPRVTRAQYERFVERLGLGDDQRLVAQLIYSDYATALHDLAARLGEETQAAGRQRVEDALAGKIIVEPGELRRMRVAVLETYRSRWGDADHLLHELIVNTESLLSEESAGDVEGAMRELRRGVYLHPRRASELDETYAGDGVDVVALAAGAAAEGGEMAGLETAGVSRILEDYERQLDALLVATAAADREGRAQHAMARIERDRDAMRREERGQLERWRQLHQINQQAVRAIGRQVGADLGAEAQRAWLDRFDRACFPWLYRATTPDKQWEWIAGHGVEDGVRAKGEEVHGAYRAAYDGQCQEAISVILKGRIGCKVMLSSRMDPSTIEDTATRELYQELLRNTGKRATLDADTTAALEGLLTERQRKQMRADIAAASYGRRRR